MSYKPARTKLVFANNAGILHDATNPDIMLRLLRASNRPAEHDVLLLVDSGDCEFRDIVPDSIDNMQSRGVPDQQHNVPVPTRHAGVQECAGKGFNGCARHVSVGLP